MSIADEVLTFGDHGVTLWLGYFFAGAAGGYLMGMSRPRPNAIWPWAWRKPAADAGEVLAGRKRVELGWFGDVLMGLAGAVVTLLIVPALGLDFEVTLNTNAVTKLIALGLVGGFAGRRLLPSMANNLGKRVDELSETVLETQEQVQTAKREAAERAQLESELRAALACQNKSAYDRAMVHYENALEVDPENTEARSGLACMKVYLSKRDRDPKLVVEALEMLDVLVQETPNSEPLRYNRAWARHVHDLMSRAANLEPCWGDEKVLEDLEHAIKLMPEGRDYLRNDESFESLKEHARFRALIDPAPAGRAPAPAKDP